MQKIQITEAKKIAERTGARQVVVIAFGEDEFAVTSYGTTKALCAEAGKWVDSLVADLESGRLPTPDAARMNRDRASNPAETEASRLSDHLQHDHPAESVGGKSVGEKWAELYEDTTGNRYMSKEEIAIANLRRAEG